MVSEHAIRNCQILIQGLYMLSKDDIAQIYYMQKSWFSYIRNRARGFREYAYPNPPQILSKKYMTNIQSFNRDESNELIDQATQLLVDELELPIRELRKEAFFIVRK